MASLFLPNQHAVDTYLRLIFLFLVGTAGSIRGGRHTLRAKQNTRTHVAACTSILLYGVRWFNVL